MKIILIKEKLKEVMGIVSDVCSRKGELNILNFFQIKAVDNKIFVSATDLEISYQAEISGRISEEGEILLPAKQFSQIIDNFYEDTITLEKKENTLIIKGENTLSSLAGLIEEEYPLIYEVKKDKYFEIENSIFEEYLNKIFCNLRTSDLFKPELSGVYFSLSPQSLTLVTTDTLRLAEVKIKKQFYSTNINETKILIPKKIIQEYLNVKRKPLKLFIYVEQHQLSFDLGNQVLVTKLMSGEFPEYKRVIPETFNLVVYVNKDEILKALKLSRVFADQTKEARLRINTQDINLEIYSKNEMLGETTNKINIDIKENSLAKNEIFEIGFNHDFLQDGLLAVEGEKIFFGLNQVNAEAHKPLLIKSPIEENFIYILMPL